MIQQNKQKSGYPIQYSITKCKWEFTYDPVQPRVPSLHIMNYHVVSVIHIWTFKRNSKLLSCTFIEPLLAKRYKSVLVNFTGQVVKIFKNNFPYKFVHCLHSHKMFQMYWLKRKEIGLQMHSFIQQLNVK